MKRKSRAWISCCITRVVTTSSRLVLFSTSSCHLCELAAALLVPWIERGWCVQEIDIAEDDGLFQRYSLTIPVLQRSDSGAELNWPFDAPALKAFLGA